VCLPPARDEEDPGVEPVILAHLAKALLDDPREPLAAIDAVHERNSEEALHCQVDVSGAAASFPGYGVEPCVPGTVTVAKERIVVEFSEGKADLTDRPSAEHVVHCPEVVGPQVLTALVLVLRENGLHPCSSSFSFI